MPAQEFDAIVVGAGFAGLYMTHRLNKLGLTVRTLERGGGVGGTWYWNRYPGARCDVESLEYSYQFDAELQDEWRWSERFSTQPEILKYCNHVADRFDLRRLVQFDTSVKAATFDEASGRWTVETADGAQMSAQFLVLATGCLSSTNIPAIEGIESYTGPKYHTGRWPHEGVDFTGKRVGVIGTGSSAIQSIPVIAEQAKHLYVFQRTPTYSVPAHNAPMDPVAEATVKADYAAFRASNNAMSFALNAPMGETGALEVDEAARREVYEKKWATGGLAFLTSFNDLVFDQGANETAGEFIRSKIAEVVEDPKIAAQLSPKHTVGCKRLCVDTGYYETFNRPNVSLVDISEAPIEAITPTGLKTADGAYELDALVFATGFDAMTGSILKIDIRGKGGEALGDAWAAGPRTYLGLSVAGFPNLFIISGPGSPSVLTNMLPSIEQHVNWIADCIGHMSERQLGRIEATEEAQEAWVAHVNEVAETTLFPTCNSWYLGANVPGKPRVFMPYIGFPPYVEKCEAVVAGGYEGFALSPLAHAG